MESVDEAERETIENIAEEFTQRWRRGEQPSVNEYVERYPAVAERLKALLPSVLILERAKQNRPLGSSGLKRSLETLNDFRIIREIGQGGMGIVYEAEQVSLQRHVALKVLPFRSRFDSSRYQRFEREAQAAARLHHSNIVPVLSFGEHDGLYYYAMQFIDGRGLDQLLREWREEQESSSTRLGPERWNRVARIGLEVAEALQYAHDQGILHRDIKPANILLDNTGNTWVADFGLAKEIDNEDLTRTGDLIGTLQYMAPEQFQYEADVRSDVYSLGLTLYELLTLEAGFQDTNPSKLIRRMSEDQPPSPRTINPGIPRDLETIVLKSIAGEPADRYQSAQLLANDLRRYLEDRPVVARRATSVERLWRWARRNRIIATLATTAAVSITLAAAVGWAGYVRTGQALTQELKLRQEAEEATRRADANVALSLAAMEDLFQKISTRRGANPSRSPLDGPPGDRPDHPPGRPDGPPGGPPGPLGFGPPPRGPGGRGGPGPGRGGPGGPGGFDRPPPPPDEREGGRNLDVAEEEAGLLKSILQFYEKFAAANSTSSSNVQDEAARAYHRVGRLYELLDQKEQAATTYRRSAELFEAQAKRETLSTRARHNLSEAWLLANVADNSPAALAGREKELRRSLALAEELTRESGNKPEHAEHAELAARAQRELGTVLSRLGHVPDAETALRQALERLDRLVLRLSDHPPIRLERASARQALADFLGKQDRLEEARTVIQGCVDDLDEIISIGRNGPPVPPNISAYYDSVAVTLSELGESELAAQLSTRAAQYRDSSRPPRN